MSHNEPAAPQAANAQPERGDTEPLVCPECGQEIDEAIASAPFFFAACRNCNVLVEITAEQWEVF